LSLQLSLSQIKHNYASQIDLTFGVAIVQPCILAQKFVCNQAITFWPNLCHLIGKIYAYLDFAIQNKSFYAQQAIKYKL
jgi:hypothetical protein